VFNANNESDKNDDVVEYDVNNSNASGASVQIVSMSASTSVANMSTMPAAQSPQDNSAVIGGVVGGAIALLLVGALVAFCVMRSRRNSEGQPDADQNTLAPQSVAVPPSNYTRISNLSDRPPSVYSATALTSEHDTYADGQLALEDVNHNEDFT